MDIIILCNIISINNYFKYNLFETCIYMYSFILQLSLILNHIYMGQNNLALLNY